MKYCGLDGGECLVGELPPINTCNHPGSGGEGSDPRALIRKIFQHSSSVQAQGHKKCPINNASNNMISNKNNNDIIQNMKNIHRLNGKNSVQNKIEGEKPKSSNNKKNSRKLKKKIAIIDNNNSGSNNSDSNRNNHKKSNLNSNCNIEDSNLALQKAMKVRLYDRRIQNQKDPTVNLISNIFMLASSKTTAPPTNSCSTNPIISPNPCELKNNILNNITARNSNIINKIHVFEGSDSNNNSDSPIHDIDDKDSENQIEDKKYGRGRDARKEKENQWRWSYRRNSHQSPVVIHIPKDGDK